MWMARLRKRSQVLEGVARHDGPRTAGGLPSIWMGGTGGPVSMRFRLMAAPYAPLLMITGTIWFQVGREMVNGFILLPIAKITVRKLKCGKFPRTARASSNSPETEDFLPTNLWMGERFTMQRRVIQVPKFGKFP